MPQPAPPIDLDAALRDVFGFDAFRPFQRRIVEATMAGRDALAVLPTGAGKSLCYQLPAALLPRATLVISPLISLMKDQYDSLPAALYERSTVINSTVGAEEMERRLGAIESGVTKLIYAAPERLRQGAFLERMARARLSLVVVDEAHCVSVWGHDFRPDYLFIRKALQSFRAHGPGPALLAVTATATPEMQREIATQLGRELDVIAAPLFRENLRLAVHPCANADEKMRRLIQLCRETQGAGIVYANSRERCESLAALLRRNGVQALHYHAGLDPDARRETQERFMAGQTRVVVATVAFGMGIDKANVRFVIHFMMPQSLESYMQEAGRAGRDGNPAACALLYAPADRANLTRWLKSEAVHLPDVRATYRALKEMSASGSRLVDIDLLAIRAFGQDADDDRRKIARVSIAIMEACGMLVRHPDSGRSMVIEMLRAPANARAAIEELIAKRQQHAEQRMQGIVRYATGNACRHVMLSRHFGQNLEPCGASCDRCAGGEVESLQAAPAPAPDLPADVGRLILSTVPALPFGLGRTGLCKVLHGSADAALKPDRCKAHGALAGMSASAAGKAIDTLIERGLLEATPEDEYRRLRLTPDGEAALAADAVILPGPRPEPPRSPRPARPARAYEPEDMTPDESDRFEALRAWRLRVARRESIPAFMVFPDSTLRAIARACPRNEQALLAVPGVGPEKLRLYGLGLLRTLCGS